MRGAGQRGRIHPGVLISRGRRRGNQQDLIAGDLVGIAVLEGVVLEEIEVEASFRFFGQGGLQIRVTKGHLGRAASRHREDFVLRIELRAQTGGAVRHAQLAFVNAGNVDVLAEAPRRRRARVRGLAFFRAEQRRLVLANEAVKDVAILDVERRDRKQVAITDGDGAGVRHVGRVRILRRGAKFRDAANGQLRCVDAKRVGRLVFIDGGKLGGVGEPATNVPNGRERGTGIERVVAAVALVQPTLTLATDGVDETDRRKRLEVAGGLIVVEVAFRRQPLERAIRHLQHASEPVAVVLHLPIVERVQRVAQVTRRGWLPDFRDVGRPIGILGCDVDVRLKEPNTKEQAAFGGLVGTRTAVEHAGGHIQLVIHRLIDIDAEVLTAVALEQRQYARFLDVLNGRVEIGGAFAMTKRDVVAHRGARLEHFTQRVIHERVAVVGNVVQGRDALTIGIQLETLQQTCGVGRIQVECSGGVEPDLLWQVTLPVLITEREVGLPFSKVSSTLREDLNNAVGGIRTVQRTCCGTLDDFHPFDILRIDIGQTESRNRTVHDHQRILTSRQRRRRAQTDRWLGARRARRGGNAGAGNLSGQAANW